MSRAPLTKFEPIQQEIIDARNRIAVLEAENGRLRNILRRLLAHAEDFFRLHNDYRERDGHNREIEPFLYSDARRVLEGGE